MSDPLAFQILEALQSRLEAISPSAGYNTDAGDRVYLGRRQINPEQLEIGPCLNIYDTADEVDEITGFGDEAAHVTLRITVDAFMRDFDMEGVKLSHLLIQDIFNALLDVTDRTVGGLTLDIGYAGRQIEYPESGGDTISASLEFTALFEMPYGNT